MTRGPIGGLRYQMDDDFIVADKAFVSPVIYLAIEAGGNFTVDIRRYMTAFADRDF